MLANLTSLTTTTYAFGALGVCLLDRRKKWEGGYLRNLQYVRVLNTMEYVAKIIKKLIKYLSICSVETGKPEYPFITLGPGFVQGPKL